MAAQKQGEEERARQAAQRRFEQEQAREAAHREAEEESRRPAIAAAPPPGAAVPAAENFETDPCKTPAARFMSTCRNR